MDDQGAQQDGGTRGSGDSPIRRRTAESQAGLYRTLLGFDSFSGRFTHMLVHESFVYYDADRTPVTDPGFIAAHEPELRKKRASAQVIADWLLEHRGISISRQQINNLRAGRRPMPRASEMNAFADYWRIDARALDPATPAELVTGVPDTETKLAAPDWHILELMNEIGLQSVQAREISSALDSSSPANKQALIEILSAISKDQKTPRDS
ncbi:hypothetical protein ACFXPA_12235 [Amycolatopsis sp. NPDC059090]|uniref:hypothetical protein n=1 Tax=unclassified Amycolatopsis TaxID=2618356 RepID=UPI0036711B2D